MRKITHWTDESHPDTPAAVGQGAALLGPLIWQVYVNGQPFVGIPAGEDGAYQKVSEYERKCRSAPNVEYVDVRLRPDRRHDEDRRDRADQHLDPENGQRYLDSWSRLSGQSPAWWTHLERRIKP